MSEEEDWRTGCPICGADATLGNMGPGAGNGGQRIMMRCQNGHEWDVRAFEFHEREGVAVERWKPLEGGKQ
jgi:hypothetical protein